MARPRTNDDYKKLWAEATGNDPDIADDQAADAHREHMKLVEKFASSMDGGPDRAGLPAEIADAMRIPSTQTSNAKGIGQQITEVVAQVRLANPSLSYEEAHTEARRIAPHLWNSRKPAPLNPTQKKAEAARLEQVQKLVNAKVANGIPYADAFNAVRNEHPALFNSMTQPARKAAR